MVPDLGINVLVPLALFSFLIFGAAFMASVGLSDLAARRAAAKK